MGFTVLLRVIFGLLAVLASLVLGRLMHSVRLDSVLVRLQDTTAEMRVRMAVVWLLGVVALAERLGLEVILGAFLAGGHPEPGVDRENLSHPNLRLKLEAIGYGFVVPVFFIASGLRFDLQALLDRPGAAR